MKISARWLRQLFPFDVEVAEAAQVLTATGLEVEGVETVEDVPGGLRGVVVGLVTDLAPHPNADRLRICTVDILICLLMESFKRILHLTARC